MANKKNTIAGQFDEYFSPLLDAIRVPQPGESGYVPVRTSMEDLAALEIEKQKANTDKQLPEMDLQTQDKLFSGITNFPAQSLDVSKPQVQTRELASSMNPAVKDYITKKLNLKSPESNVDLSNQPSVKPSIFDKYNEDAYNKAKADYEDKSSGLGALQFIAGIGDAMAGRNSSETAKNFNNIRANIKDNTVGEFLRNKESAISDFKNKQVMDAYNPDSESSKAFRKMIEAKFPDVAKSYGKMWNQVSASDKENIFEPLKLKESIEARKEQARILSQQRTDALNAKLSEKNDKKKQTMFEIEDRYRNIKDNIKNLKTMIDKTGTYEAFGPENKQMDQYITSVATDMAKLVDPQSVARESEVESFKKMLIEPSFWQRESTAQGVLDNFDKMVDKRLSNAYTVRGLESPKYESTQFPMQVRKGNQTATVSNEQELKEAKSEGWN